MREAIEVLEKAESVLMKRIRAMRDGKPKYAASERLNELRAALTLIKTVEREVDILKEEQDAILMESLILNPPIAQA